VDITPIVQQGIAEGVFPGAVVYIAEGGKTLCHEAFGRRMITPEKKPMRRDTLFDLASLTKPIVVGTLMMRLAEHSDIDKGENKPPDSGMRTNPQLIDLDAAFQTYFPEFIHAQVTVRYLLTHTSGLPAWRPTYLEAGTKEQVVDYLCRLGLEYPTGTKVVYSCLGYILLGKLIERLTGKSLDALAREWIFQPLGMNWTRYNPPPEWADLCAATEDSNSVEKRMTNYQRYDWREGVIVGEVHDENAHFLGGVSGNAGLFSTAADLARFCQMLVDGGDGVLKPESIRRMATVYTEGLDAARGIGWMILGDGSLYHTGFTGTSIRINLERKMYGILLTNRVHPDASRPGIVEFRSKFYRAVFG
jgi:CubicO group peptidase (beta-lactamase class C family)